MLTYAGEDARRRHRRRLPPRYRALTSTSRSRHCIVFNAVKRAMLAMTSPTLQHRHPALSATVMPQPISPRSAAEPPRKEEKLGATSGDATCTRSFATLDNVAAHPRRQSLELRPSSWGEVPILGYMEQLNQTKFYQLGNDGSLIFERDLDALSEHLGRPHPEFFRTQVNDQTGGELQWIVVANLRGKMELPMSERIHFSIRENNWLDGLARALQEALARLCGQNVTQIEGTRFTHLARHDSIGGPMDLPSHPELKHHVEHLDYMLHETQKELENSRVYANQTHLHLSQQTDAIKMLAKDRKSLGLQRAKKDSTIARLRAKIASLEETVQSQETQLRALEEESEDIQGGAAYLSDDDEFEEDENTDVEDYEFLEAGEDDFIEIDD
ncbi:hypothetical protein QYE76_071155 [Lolium multiflorum]|uniref:Uncharacterized protein n=1 Tax=Lolium multiflorum TaxID=4521 RepID=A0AAD8SJ81_LOLMU|nr:hypothetical protein QYE76_071155 [Lolium multiflorum]